MSSIRAFEDRLLPGSAGAAITTAVWPGGGEPLVCVHGLTSSSRAFAGLATELPDRAMLAVDCRGRGNSSKQGPFGLARHADDLAPSWPPPDTILVSRPGAAAVADAIEAFTGSRLGAA